MPDGRSIQSSGGISRGASTARAFNATGITRGSSGRGVATAEQTAAYNAQIPPSQAAIDAINQAINQNIGSRVQVPWSPYLAANQATAVSPTVPSGTFYGTDNPFLVLSDVFRNILGNDGDSGQSTQTGQALVPVTSSTGGSNILVLLLVVGIVGAIAYYFYKKRQSQ